MPTRTPRTARPAKPAAAKSTPVAADDGSVAPTPTPTPTPTSTPEAAPAAAKPRAAKRAQPQGKAKAVARAKPAAAAKAERTAKGAKPRIKLVRDSFTMPEADFALIGTLKERAVHARRPAKKSELLRAGLHALAALPGDQLVQALDKLAAVKMGRPKKGH